VRPSYYFSDEPEPFFLAAIRSLLDKLPADSAVGVGQELHSILTNVKPIEINHPIPEEDDANLIFPVLNFPRLHTPEFLERITPSIAERVNEGRLRLFFDHCNEANSARAIEVFGARLRGCGITRFSNIYWICSNHAVPATTSGINHLKLDYFPLMAFLNLLSTDMQAAWDIEAMANSYREAATQPYTLCLNATPRPGRIATILSLIHSGIFPMDRYQPDSFPQMPYLSFGGFNDVKYGGITVQEAREWLNANQLSHLIPYLDWIQDKELGVDHFQEKGNALFDCIDINPYRKTVLSVVTETEVTSDLLRITEKTLKPYLLGHPVIVIGNRGSLDLVRSLGFQTFDQSIDPSYDAIGECGARVEAASLVAKRFIETLQGNPALIESEILPASAHNIAWAKNSLVDTFVKQQAAPVCQALFC
jgi:hypothetical protein